MYSFFVGADPDTIENLGYGYSKDIDNINQWITHLHDNQKEQEQNLKKLEGSLRGAFGTYNKYLLDVYKMVHKLKHDLKEEVKEHSMRAVETLIDVDKRQISSKDSELKENVVTNYATNNNSEIALAQVKTYESENDVFNQTKKSLESYETIETSTNEDGPLVNISKKLTRGEKLILAHLTSSNQKLSYKDISMLMNLSVSTVKNHVCNIRNKGFPLMEYNDAGNIKRYYISDNMKKIVLATKF